MSETEGRQEGLGKTGGLPGHHADARTRVPTNDDLADTVSMADVDAPGEADERREATDAHPQIDEDTESA